GDDVHRQKLREASARNRRRSARQRFGGTEKRLAQITRPAQRTDLRELGAEAAAKAADDMTRGTPKTPVDLGPALRVALRRPPRRATERFHVGDEVIQLAVGQAAHARHAAVGDAVADDLAQRSVVGGAGQRGPGEVRSLLARAVDAMTTSAHALKELFALGK